MNKYKLILLTFLSFAAFGILAIVSCKLGGNDPKKEETLGITTDTNLGIIVTEAKLKTLEYLYKPDETQSFAQISVNNNCKVAVNGSYFTKEHTHAGLLTINGEKIKGKGIDNQLTSIVVLDRAQDKISYFDLDSFESTPKENKIEIQTGPMIIKNNVIDVKAIEKSINGMENRRRTILISTENELFFLTAYKNYNLKELAQIILDMQKFKGKEINAINLDGGSSTAYYNSNKPELNYNSTKVLPLIFCIK